MYENVMATYMFGAEILLSVCALIFAAGCLVIAHHLVFGKGTLRLQLGSLVFEITKHNLL